MQTLLPGTLKNLFFPSAKTEFTYFAAAKTRPFTVGDHFVQAAWAADLRGRGGHGPRGCRRVRSRHAGCVVGLRRGEQFDAFVWRVLAPQRNIPQAFFGGMAIVEALYIFANLAYYYVLTPTEIASIPVTPSVATEVMKRFLGLPLSD